MLSRRLLAASLLATLSGCSFAPPYHPPTVSTPAAYKETAPWIRAEPAELAAKGDWWTGFGDPALNGLEQQIATGNFTLAASLARFDRARAYLAEARSDTGVHGVVEGSTSRNRQSNDRPLRGANQPDVYTANDVDLSFSYEVDLWGRVRNAIAAGRAEAAASAADLAALKLSLQSELASQYIMLRSYDRQLDLLDATVATYQQADALTRRRFAGGIASGLDTGRSGTQLAEAQA
ncbi:MAG: TolC family protein, partial [Janthinobacterium lividum]